MSDDDKNFLKAFEKLEKTLNKTANRAMEEANQEAKQISKETKQLANKVKNEYRNNYEDIERRAISVMTEVYDHAKVKLDRLAEEAQGGSSTREDLEKRAEQIRKKANRKLEMVRIASEADMESSAKEELNEICPDATTSEDYYKCTLKEAYKKAASLFDDQRKQFAEQSEKTYSSIMKEMDKSYSSVIQAARNKSSSTNDNQGSSKKGSRS